MCFPLEAVFLSAVGGGDVLFDWWRLLIPRREVFVVVGRRCLFRLVCIVN